MSTSVAVYLDGHTHHITPGLTRGQDLSQHLHIPPDKFLELEDGHHQHRVPIASNDRLVVHPETRFFTKHLPYPEHDNPTLPHGIRPNYNGHEISEHEAFHHAKATFQQLSKLDKHFGAGDSISIVYEGLPDEKIDPNAPFVVQHKDHLVTVPAGNVGRESVFEQQVAALRDLYGKVEVVAEPARTLLVVKELPLPKFWSREKTDLLVQVPQGYPITALDMFWVSDELKLADGRPAQQAQYYGDAFFGKAWQRFSWHYAVAWNPACDTVITHVAFCVSRFALNS